MSTLDELLIRVGKLRPEDQLVVINEAHLHTAGMRFVPNPGTQTEAYVSQADILLYGGRAGGGKTLLELGWAINEADSGIIFRRQRTETDGLEKEGKVIIGNAARFNGTDIEWTWPSGKTLKLAGMNQPESWRDHAGRERDYYGFDEAGEFLELQVASILAWLRAAPGKRTRVILGSNPPRTADGLWMVKWFAPWLDSKFPKPAVPGELRWAIRVSRNEEIEVVWVDGPGEYEVDGEPYTAQSYTFIPASLEDNPYRNTGAYKAQLQSLPEPLRSQLLYGKFSTRLKDLANQIIPTSWVQLAMDRWTDKPARGLPMCAIGVDASGGGEDPMILAPRYDGWYAPLIQVPGADIPVDRAGAFCAGIVVSHRRDEALVVIDMGGGYGGPMYEHLVTNKVKCYRYKGAEGSTRVSRDGKLKFKNKRTSALWGFREALDPGQPGGSPIALPPDNRMMADLTAPTFHVGPQGIEAEPKDKVCERLGRSTDRGDAVVMAWYDGPRKLTDALDWMGRVEVDGRLVRPPQVVNGGRTPLSARRRA